MRKVVAAEFLSLDGVMESPDKWHFPYFNEEMGQAIGEGFAAADAMLMGRVNYEEWAAFWPGQDPQENPMAAQMNAMQKYVVSTTLEEPLGWQNSTLIGENAAEEIARLKQEEGGDIVISGSGALVRSLLQYGLLDEFKLMIHPVLVGGGKAFPYRLTHLLVEVGEVPLVGGLHHPIQRQKLRSDHFPHMDLL